MKKKTGLTGGLEQKSTDALRAYMIICAGCGLATFANLWVRGIGFSALASGDDGQAQLFLVSIAVITLCIAGTAVFFGAIMRRRD